MEDNKSGRKKQFVYPDLIFNGIVLFYLIMGLLITLAIIKPFGLGDVADPLRSPDVVKPEWYFLAFFQFINYLPKGIGTGIVFLGIFLFCLWPFLPGVKGAGGKSKLRNSFFRLLGLLFVFSYLLLTLVGYLAESDRVFFGRKYHFDTKGIPHRIIETRVPSKMESGSVQTGEREEQKRP